MNSFKPKILKILILAGGAGYGNVGDEAALSMLLKYLSRSFPFCEILVCTYDPIETEEMHHVNACKLVSSGTLISFLSADILAIGGAGLINKSNFFGSGLRHFPLYLVPGAPTFMLSILAKLLGKKVIFHAVGVTDVPHPVLKLLLPIATNLCDHISVRDSISKKVLEKMGCKKDIQVLLDPVVNLEPIEAEAARLLLLQEGINMKGFIVGISLRYVERDSVNRIIVKEFSKIINWLIENKGAEVVFFSMSKHKLKQVENDELIGEEIGSFIRKRDQFSILKGNYTPQEIKAMISQTRLFIGMRLHSIVFSLSMDVPSIGIIYDTKVQAFLQDMGQEGIDVNKIDFDEMKRKIDSIIGKR